SLRNTSRGTLVLASKRAPGSVKVRTGGDSPRPGRCHRPADPVGLRDRRVKSGWEAARARGRLALAVPPGRPGQAASAPLAHPRSPCKALAPEEDTVFTGIVEELGEVVGIDMSGDSARIRIRGPVVTADSARGDSIAINGVCLTVTASQDG